MLCPTYPRQVGSTAKANIKIVYTASLAADLLELPVTVLKPVGKLGASLKGWVSNANTNWARKGGWLFFINRLSLAVQYREGIDIPLDRLVDSSKIKKAIDSLYTAYLPKGASPWVYLRYLIVKGNASHAKPRTASRLTLLRLM